MSEICEEHKQKFTYYCVTDKAHRCTLCPCRKTTSGHDCKSYQTIQTKLIADAPNASVVKEKIQELYEQDSRNLGEQLKTICDRQVIQKAFDNVRQLKRWLKERLLELSCDSQEEVTIECEQDTLAEEVKDKMAEAEKYEKLKAMFGNKDEKQLVSAFDHYEDFVKLKQAVLELQSKKTLSARMPTINSRVQKLTEKRASIVIKIEEARAAYAQELQELFQPNTESNLFVMLRFISQAYLVS